MNRVKKIVNAIKVYERGYSGRGVGIAVVDSGCSPCPGLGNNPVFFKDFVRGKKQAYDDYGHGTHIAGILAGRGRNWTGMAPGAGIIALKVLDGQGNGSTEAALAALRWVMENYKRYGIRLLNFSMGYQPGGNRYQKKSLMEAVDLLWDQGVCVVAAAGNNGPGKGSVTIPGISRKVITVGASDDGGGYSGWGPTGCCIVKPEILAPGTGIRSLSNHFIRHGDFMPGTGIRSLSDHTAGDGDFMPDAGIEGVSGDNARSKNPMSVPGTGRLFDYPESETGRLNDHPEPGTGRNYRSRRPGRNPGASREEEAVRSGTSMAVPVVCGALALALEQRPELTPAMLKLRLYQTVRSPARGERRRCWGLLDVDRLLEV